MALINPPITGNVQVDSWSQQVTEEIRQLHAFGLTTSSVKEIAEEAAANVAQGTPGADGVSITNAYVDGSNHLIFDLSDGQSFDVGDISAIFAAAVSTWVNYAEEWSSAPTLHSSPAGGDLYEYTYNNGSLYRFVPDPYDATQDKFYSDSAMTTLVATRASNI